jgi:hypothetical protein
MDQAGARLGLFAVRFRRWPPLQTSGNQALGICGKPDSYAFRLRAIR